ncbi:hypothetical protein [Rugamonas sp. DEMB1]|uniref:hypothetical protein n=1 Tax=Rugamonas sp. DEMB1 TaxID=3039386 RepID=UPI002449DD7E|nr:hypothetical protein [Rugamonas sp. DEMB1]WGG52166.1 hypothetical protein QC826_08310 [Rugamonas sp. DEMB1]
MNYAPLLVATPAIVAILTGCDQLAAKHEIVRAGNQTFLLNKSTGDAKLIDGTSLVAVKQPDSASANEPFKKAKNWEEQSITDLQGVKFKLRTKYRDGSMLWIVEATPFQGALENIYKAAKIEDLRQPTVHLELSDDERFKTGESIAIMIRMGTRTVNEKGEIASLSWSGTQTISAETYRSAAFVSTKWFGFSKE